MTSTAEPLNDHASSAKNEVLRAEQRPVGAGRLRLDALTIAGLTGTPHNGGDTARFFGTAAEGASASPRSPAAGSDDTLCSIQDSSVAEEVCAGVVCVRMFCLSSSRRRSTHLHGV